MKKIVKKTSRAKCFRFQTKVCKLSDIEFDRDYQRKMKPGSVKSIVKDFRAELVNHPKLGERPDGSLFCWDGQHTVAGLVELGYTHCECDVYETKNAQQEADLFVLANTERKAVNSCEKHLARLRAGFTTARDIDNALKRLNIGIKGQADSKGVVGAKSSYNFYISCVRPLYDAEKDGVLYDLVNTMGMLWETKQSWCSEFVYGLATFLNKHKEDIESKNLVRMCKSMRSQPFEVIHGDLKKVIGNKGAKEGTMVVAYFKGCYNKGLRIGKLV